jgi:hypothetical protein
MFAIGCLARAMVCSTANGIVGGDSSNLDDIDSNVATIHEPNRLDPEWVQNKLAGGSVDVFSQARVQSDRSWPVYSRRSHSCQSGRRYSCAWWG